MLGIRTILHPTDFSARSENAFRLACSLARDHGAGLVVLHVVPAPTAVLVGEGIVVPWVEDDFQALEAKLRQVRPQDPDIAITHRLARGEPVHEILRAAGETNCDLIVLGTHGRRGLARFLMGSVAEQVVRKASCPVVTVKTPVAEPPPPDIEVLEPAGRTTGVGPG
jgi:nucleotide-binding universal stress UspA family protein